MSIRLKDKNKPGPNGFMIHEQRTGWKSWESDPQTQWNFPLLVQRYREHCLANQHLGLALPTDPKVIEDYCDLANALRYARIPGAEIYIVRGGDSAPKTVARNSLVNSVAQVVAGAKIIIDWIKSKEEAVPPDVSAKRALICVACPRHGTGDWTKYFTEPAAAAIRKEYQRRTGMELSTPSDDKLNVCEACNCPMKLKVHMPIERIREGLSEKQRAELDPGCWIP